MVGRAVLTPQHHLAEDGGEPAYGLLPLVGPSRHGVHHPPLKPSFPPILLHWNSHWCRSAETYRQQQQAASSACSPLAQLRYKPASENAEHRGTVHGMCAQHKKAQPWILRHHRHSPKARMWLLLQKGTIILPSPPMQEQHRLLTATLPCCIA